VLGGQLSLMGPLNGSIHLYAGGNLQTSLNAKGNVNSYINAGGNNLGIRTSTPTANLHVVGSTLISGSLTLTGSLQVSGSIDSDNRQLIDGNSNIAVDWNNRQLIDGNSATSVDWNNRQLIDVDEVEVVNWGERYLATPGGNSFYNFSNDTVATSKVYHQYFTDGDYRESLSNNLYAFTGQAEDYTCAIHSSCVAGQLVFLDPAGAWYPVDQTTAASTKLLGLWNGDNMILLEGTMVVDTLT
jgi:hypothetical protein